MRKDIVEGQAYATGWMFKSEKEPTPGLYPGVSFLLVIENAGRGGPGRPGPSDQPAEAYILDDPNTPLMLSWMLGENMKQYDSFKVQLVRVTYPHNKPTIEAATREEPQSDHVRNQLRLQQRRDPAGVGTGTSRDRASDGRQTGLEADHYRAYRQHRRRQI